MRLFSNLITLQGFLQVFFFAFPPASQKHTVVWIVCAWCPMMDWTSVNSVFSACPGCSQDRLWILHDPNQDKAINKVKRIHHLCSLLSPRVFTVNPLNHLYNPQHDSWCCWMAVSHGGYCRTKLSTSLGQSELINPTCTNLTRYTHEQSKVWSTDSSFPAGVHSVDWMNRLWPNFFFTVY